MKTVYIVIGRIIVPYEGNREEIVAVFDDQDKANDCVNQEMKRRDGYDTLYCHYHYEKWQIEE